MRMSTYIYELSQQSRINRISWNLERIMTEVYQYQAHIEVVDTLMNRNVALTLEVATSRIKVVSQLLSQSPPRNFAAAKIALDNDFTQIKEDFLVNYQSLLKARDACMKQGKEILLTPSVQSVLLEDYSTELRQKLSEFQNSFEITDSTDLIKLKEKLENEKKLNEDILNQIFEQKTKLISELIDLEKGKKTRQLVEEKRDIQSVTQSKDIWDASDKGDTQFLKTQIAKIPNSSKKRNSIGNFFSFKISNSNNNSITPNEILDQLKEGFTPLHLAIGKGHVDTVQFLLNAGANPSLPDQWGNKPLHFASKVGSTAIVSELLKHKVDINARGDYGRTPLNYAAFNGHQDVVSLLLKNGADVNAQSGQTDGKKTPLHDAISRGHKNTVLVLLNAPNIDVYIQDANGHDMLYYAVENGFVDMMALIVSHKSWKPQANYAELENLNPRQNAIEVKKCLRELPRKR